MTQQRIEEIKELALWYKLQNGQRSTGRLLEECVSEIECLKRENSEMLKYMGINCAGCVYWEKHGPKCPNSARPYVDDKPIQRCDNFKFVGVNN